VRDITEKDARRLLPWVFLALILDVIFHVGDNSLALLNVPEGLHPFSVSVVVAAMIADVILITLLVALGIRLLKSDAPDNTDEVNRCECLSIAAMGVCVVSWIVESIFDKSMFDATAVSAAATIIIGFAYYRLVDKLERTSFWDGIMVNPDVSSRCVARAKLGDLTLDAETGELHESVDGETPDVRIMSEDQYVGTLPRGMAESVILPMKTIRFSSCLQLGESIYGYLNIPVEIQRLCGFPATSDIGFLFEFDDECLTFVLPESGEAHTFIGELISRCGGIHTSLMMIPQMTISVLTYTSAWLRDCESSLLKLERKLSEELYEMPKGFSEYVNGRRLELGVLFSFCRGMGDMMEDLADVTDEWGEDDVSNQCQVVAHQIDRMASDAEDVRDFAGEIRTEYQERIEVRQNNVINVLTIVTTVFTPLSLVAGWYGMNFVNMPELKIGDAYFILAALMILFIAGEFAIFKRHRWF